MLMRFCLRRDFPYASPAQEVTGAEWEKIYESIVRILNKAVAYRGTSQRDYVDGRGEAGEFQHHLKVYGRKKKGNLFGMW